MARNRLSDHGFDDHWRAVLLITVALTIVRLVTLFASPLELYPDEAQYWLWSQTPAWGYFSKPPLLAWITAGAARLCGHGEACLRAPSAVAWGATALLVFSTGWVLYGRRTAWRLATCRKPSPPAASWRLT